MLSSNYFQVISGQIYKSHLWIPPSLLPLEFSVEGIIYLLVAIRWKDDYSVLWVKYCIDLDTGYPGHMLFTNIFSKKNNNNLFCWKKIVLTRAKFPK